MAGEIQSGAEGSTKAELTSAAGALLSQVSLLLDASSNGQEQGGGGGGDGGDGSGDEGGDGTLEPSVGGTELRDFANALGVALVGAANHSHAAAEGSRSDAAIPALSTVDASGGNISVQVLFGAVAVNNTGALRLATPAGVLTLPAALLRPPSPLGTSQADAQGGAPRASLYSELAVVVYSGDAALALSRLSFRRTSASRRVLLSAAEAESAAEADGTDARLASGIIDIFRLQRGSDGCNGCNSSDSDVGILEAPFEVSLQHAPLEQAATGPMPAPPSP